MESVRHKRSGEDLRGERDPERVPEERPDKEKAIVHVVEELALLLVRLVAVRLLEMAHGIGNCLEKRQRGQERHEKDYGEDTSVAELEASVVDNIRVYACENECG